MDVKHLRRFELRFVLTRMDTVHGTHVHAGRVLRAYARFGDDVRHEQSSKTLSVPQPFIYCAARSRVVFLSAAEVGALLNRDSAREPVAVAVIAADRGLRIPPARVAGAVCG